VSRTIKRYANRKLYDTTQSCYVTLDEISEFVRNGEEVRIVDNTTSEDLTAVTLAQILFEAEKRKKKTLPLSTLQQLIRSGGEIFEKTITQPVASFRAETEKVTTNIVDTTRGTLENFQESVRSMMATVTQIKKPGGDLEQIHNRLDKIEARLAALEGTSE
jgi:polyhydroxyalkanoate synthesis repressor PhaR